MTLVGKPFPLGLSHTDDRTNVAIYSEVAEAVELCLFDDDGNETRIGLPERSANVWHGSVERLADGQRYGVRVHGPWDPQNGLRCNGAKLLIDPHATAIEGDVEWDEAVFGHRFGDPDSINQDDSARFVPKSIVTDSDFDWGTDAPPSVALDDSVIYETHVKGFTVTHPDVPEELRGTYAGLAHDASISYLTELGVTTVELLPVHHFVQDSMLLDKGLRNYWGYNSIGFLAPYSGYSASGTRGQQVDEFKAMVKALHAAGLEVILDVVYNHTAEGNHLGPTLSFKGIDNLAYYRSVEGNAASYFDTTGTGNSFNVGHPAALRQIMDSLRYWVTEMHVDGFRFDLATTLTRQYGDVDRHSAFLDLVHQEPLLASVKLIAEPWDIGDFGYQVGGFPPRWSEWNGRYRDDIRDFWRGEGSIGDFGLRLTGSGDIYGSANRGPTASVNFITAHDGFTLADLTAYNEKHNEGNGEDNQDGDNSNSSWNCGAEGDTDDEGVLALRSRQRRNMIATLLLSHGVPMLLGGDESARSQGGNNNAYCQDNEVSWFDWTNGDEELLTFTKKLIEFRAQHPALRRRRYARGVDAQPEVVMYRADGVVMNNDDWQDEQSKTLAVVIDGEQLDEPELDGSSPTDESFVVLVNAHDDAVEFTVPKASGVEQWHVEIATDDRVEIDARTRSGEVFLLGSHSLVLLSS